MTVSVFFGFSVMNLSDGTFQIGWSFTLRYLNSTQIPSAGTEGKIFLVGPIVPCIIWIHFNPLNRLAFDLTRAIRMSYRMIMLREILNIPK